MGNWGRGSGSGGGRKLPEPILWSETNQNQVKFASEICGGRSEKIVKNLVFLLKEEIRPRNGEQETSQVKTDNLKQMYGVGRVGGGGYFEMTIVPSSQLLV